MHGEASAFYLIISVISCLHKIYLSTQISGLESGHKITKICDSSSSPCGTFLPHTVELLASCIYSTTFVMNYAPFHVVDINNENSIISLLSVLSGCTLHIILAAQYSSVLPSLRFMANTALSNRESWSQSFLGHKHSTTKPRSSNLNIS
jgi:hypothetical protein